MKKNDLLLVIDMQNVYLPGEEWGCPSAPDAVRNICRLLDADVAEHVVFTRFVPPNPAEGTWKDYNIANADINASEYLNDMMDGLKQYPAKNPVRYPVYDKSTYTSCRVPEVIEIMKTAERIVLTGVVADCCVLATMMEAIDNGWKVVYLTDCVAGSTIENEEAVARIAETLSPVQTLVMSSEEYLSEKNSKSI